MTTAPTDETTRTSLRLWPAVAFVVLIWLLKLGVPRFAPDAIPLDMIGGAVGAVLVFLWWLFFSRAPWSERLGGAALMVVALLVTRQFLDVTLARAGMGLIFYIHALPVLATAMVIWAAATRGLPLATRRATMVATIVIACGVWTFVRTDGVTGSFSSQFAWRWSQTAEERLLALAADEPMSTAPATRADAATMDTGPGWPGFRGPNRDSVIPGVRIETDWTTSPPVELWRRPIGPGWSSFAVRGDLFYTQEQRGEEEIVAAYSVTTGEPMWRHRDPVRFWESEGGVGPRGTPTVRGDRVYALGATGILNALNADDGARVWSRDVAADSGVAIPGWGFASSPLVVGDMVVIAASGRLVAYDLVTGEPRWLGPAQGGGYSSPHLLEIDGVLQIVLMGGPKATSVSPADGTVLWEHEWPAGSRIVQPALTADGDLLISGGERTGLRSIAVAQGAGGWATEERWTTNRLKPYYSDFVIHDGHAYGFDGTILACIDVATGERKWKGGRYGTGQLVLLRDQSVLLVVTEDGELALVAAAPDQFTELALVPAMNGKTWNHPVLVDDLLLVRNGQEMVAFRLTLAG